jgi:signal transduction histidine kinase
MNLTQRNNVVLFLIFFLSLGVRPFLQNDSFDALSQEAENAFLSGNITEARDLYIQALELDESLDNSEYKLNRLKLIELLSLSLQQLGECDLVTKYLTPLLTEDVDKVAVSRAVREMIRCVNVQNTEFEENLQSQILSFFNIQRVDQNAHDQLSIFLSDPYTDEQDFSDFFLLFEYGFLPALKSLEREQEANRRTDQRTLIAVISLFLMLALGFVLYTVKRQKDHIQRENVALLTGKEKESDRLSVDLHDILGYKIVELKNQVNRLENSNTSKVQDLSKGLDQLHESMRFIVQSNLTPESLKFGLGPALDTLFNRVNAIGVLRFSLYKHGLDEKLPEEKEKHAFYIIQELVNNVIKHSKSTKASFEISRLKGELSILAEDDGIGYNPSIDTLKTVKSRVSYLSGNVIEESIVDKGTTIIVNIPL